MFALAIIPAPPRIPREQGSIVVSDQHGVQRWTAEWTMEPTRESGKPAVRFTETGRGHFSPYTQPIQWKIEAIWIADAAFYPLRFEKTVSDLKGRVITTEHKSFDPGRHVVRFERKGDALPPVTKNLQAPQDTLTVEGIAGILRFLPLDHWRPLTVHFLTGEPRIYEMKVEMRGKERVKTTAGEFECYRIEMLPSLGVLNVLHAFVPKAQFWFSASEPHFWVRYEGPENGRGSPQVVMELKTYQPEKTGR
jgi:hypothetical protein